MSGGSRFCLRPRTLHEVRERMAYARTTGEPFVQALVRHELP
ncbi:hypothetical protein [Streptomyces sp. NEAU-YJ-81]